MVIIKLPKMESYIGILNLPISSFPIIKSKLLISALLWKMLILKSILHTMLDHPFTCHQKHSIKINTVLKVIFGHLVSFITKCLLEKHHGEPKLKNNSENNFLPFLSKDSSLKIFAKLQLIFLKEPLQSTLMIEWLLNNWADFFLH